MNDLLTVSRPKLERYARRNCVLSDIDDAVQEALLALSRHAPRIRSMAGLSSWLFTTVRRACHRLAQKTLRVDLWEDARISASLSGVSTEALRLDIARAIESLPAHYRDVLLLRDVQELTIREIGAQLGLTPANVKSRLHRARALTREYLEA